MATIVGVRFKEVGKIYYFDPNGLDPKPRDKVIVETARGTEFGEVAFGAREIEQESITSPLKRVLRMATERDLKRSKRTGKKNGPPLRSASKKSKSTSCR